MVFCVRIWAVGVGYTLELTRMLLTYEEYHQPLTRIVHQDTLHGYRRFNWTVQIPAATGHMMMVNIGNREWDLVTASANMQCG